MATFSFCLVPFNSLFHSVIILVVVVAFFTFTFVICKCESFDTGIKLSLFFFSMLCPDEMTSQCDCSCLWFCSVCVCVLFSVESHMHSFTRLLNEKFGLLRVSIYFPSFHGWNALHLPWFAMASHCYCIGNGFLIHIIIITHKKRRQKNEWTPHYNECEHLQSQVKDTYRTNERASARAMCMRSFRLAPCSECNCMCHVYVAGFYTL